MVTSTFRFAIAVVTVAIGSALGGCSLDLGAGDPHGSNGTVSGATVQDFDGGVFPVRPGSGTGGTSGSSDPCFVPCNGGYGSQCGWICGSGTNF